MSNVRVEIAPELGRRVVRAWGNVSSEAPVMRGPDFGQGALHALLVAEELAEAATIKKPTAILGNDGKPIRVVGAARGAIDDPSIPMPEGVRELYLATHGAVRRAQATSSRTTDAITVTPQIGVLPAAAVVVLAVGLAAVVAGAWYMQAEARLRLDAGTLRQASRITTATTLAREELARTGKLPPELWQFLKHEADAEAAAVTPTGAGQFLGPALIVGGMLAGGLYLAGRLHGR